ncbi:uncharacterized protein VTP21DRAFT_7991 [Calcarisporiella thermophila]|uniref:uncharacterized protein n=1 Tax=Calcarisporiella thermophila TaxID=911321 RepID=UPI003743D24D
MQYRSLLSFQPLLNTASPIFFCSLSLLHFILGHSQWGWAFLYLSPLIRGAILPCHDPPPPHLNHSTPPFDSSTLRRAKERKVVKLIGPKQKRNE